MACNPNDLRTRLNFPVYMQYRQENEAWVISVSINGDDLASALDSDHIIRAALDVLASKVADLVPPEVVEEAVRRCSTPTTTETNSVASNAIKRAMDKRAAEESLSQSKQEHRQWVRDTIRRMELSESIYGKPLPNTPETEKLLRQVDGRDPLPPVAPGEKQ